MTFEEYEKKRDALIKKGNGIKNDIKIRISEHRIYREKIDVQIIYWGFQRADKVITAWNIKDLRARISALENPESSFDFLSFLVTIFLIPGLGRAIGGIFKNGIIQNTKVGAKMLTAIDKFLKPDSDGEKEKLMLEFLSKDLAQDSGKGLAKELFKLFKHSYKTLPEDAEVNRSKTFKESPESEISPARGFLKEIQDNILSVDWDWKEFVLYLDKNEPNMPFYLGPLALDYLLAESPDEKEEKAREKSRIAELVRLEGSLAPLRDLQQSIYLLVFQAQETKHQWVQDRIIPRDSQLWLARQIRENADADVPGDYEEKLTLDAGGNIFTHWRAGNEIPRLSKEAIQTEQALTEKMYLGLLLSIGCQLSNDIFPIKIEDTPSLRIIPLKAKIVDISAATNLGIQSPRNYITFQNPDLSHPGNLGKLPNQQGGSAYYGKYIYDYLGTGQTYLPYLKTLSSSAVLQMASILIYPDEIAIGEIKFPKGVTVMDAARNNMYLNIPENDKPHHDFLAEYWTLDNPPTGDALYTLYFYLDQALLLYRTYIKQGKMLTDSVSKELESHSAKKTGKSLIKQTK